MMAAMGKQLKQSVNVFHSLMLYLRLPATQPCNVTHLVYMSSLCLSSLNQVLCEPNIHPDMLICYFMKNVTLYID